MTTTADWLAKIPPEHAGQPDFSTTVALSVDPLVRLQTALESLYLDFDLDQAVGPQLDAVGVRVGRSRQVTLPLQGLFFSFDDPLRGLDQGIWKGPFDVGNSTYLLDDDTYRRLLRSKILLNSWDGTIASAEAIYRVYFTDPTVLLFVSDDAISSQPQSFFSFDDALRGLDQGSWSPVGATQGEPSVQTVDMVMTVGFAGNRPGLVDLALLSQGLLGPKPEGVSVDVEVASVNGAALFGLDMEGPYVAGFDVGAWGVSPSALLKA